MAASCFDIVNQEVGVKLQEEQKILECSFCVRSYDKLREEIEGERAEDDFDLLRILPCHCANLCCRQCFVEKCDYDRVLKCPTCSQDQKLTDFSSLPSALPKEHSNNSYQSQSDLHACKLSSVSTSSNVQAEEYPQEDDTEQDFQCDKCPQLAAKYCAEITCQEKYCETHLRCHDAHFEGKNHKMLDRKDHRDSPHLHGVDPICEGIGHTEHACRKCFKRACSECRLSELDQSEEVICSDGENHDWQSVTDGDNEVKARFQKLTDQMDKKITDYLAAVEIAENNITKLRTENKILKNNVKSSGQKHIERIKEHSTRIQDKVESHLLENNTSCADYRQYSQDKIDQLKRLKQTVRDLNKKNPLIKFHKWEEINEQIASAIEEALPSCQWKQPLAYESVGSGSCAQLESDVREIPKSLEFASPAYKTERCCYDVAFQDKRVLWVAHENGLTFYNLCPTEPHLQPMCSPEKIGHEELPCTAVAPRKANIYYVVEEEDSQTGKVKALLYTKHGCSDSLKLFEYEKEAGSVADLAACDNFLALSDKKQNKIIIYNLAKEESKRYQLTEFPSGVCFHPDGDLLVTDLKNGTLSKHSISSEGVPDLTPPVVCQGLEDPDAICTDSSGLIYVKSNSLKLLYVISNGAVIKTLREEEICIAPGGIAINGDRCVLAGYGAGEVKCFTIKRDEQA